MRNKFPGTCYRCGKPVAIGAGHFERHNGGWRTQHAACAIKFRGTKTTAQPPRNGAGSNAKGRADA